MALDHTYRIQIPHEKGQLAKVTGAIADADGVIGDLETVTVTRDHSIREITVEVVDDEHAERVAERLGALDGVEVLQQRDRAMARHEGGKLRVETVGRIETRQDMRDVYTPGVARVARAIADDPGLASRYTMTGSTVAICTNGTRVLGLGDVGPRAAMPVMEGKAIFYRRCADLSAMPIVIDAADKEEFVRTVTSIAPTFGGIHLEDIEAPDCFEIEARLIDALDQPVMHDDVHGTAVVALAAALAGCHLQGRELKQQTIGQLGLGAAGYGIASLFRDSGAARVLAFDPSEETHERARRQGIELAEADAVVHDADVLVATTGKPGSITAEMVQDGQIVLALSNPDPEIEPQAALEAGAAYAADGTIVNNVLGFPGIFKGALMAGADAITREMKVAAAHAIAEGVKEAELAPDPLDRSLHEHVAEAVQAAA